MTSVTGAQLGNYISQPVTAGDNTDLYRQRGVAAAECELDLFVPRFIMCAILISKALGLARVNEASHSFSCHPHVIYPHVE